MMAKFFFRSLWVNLEGEHTISQRPRFQGLLQLSISSYDMKDLAYLCFEFLIGQDFATQVYWSKMYSAKCRAEGVKKQVYATPDVAEYFGGLNLKRKIKTTIMSNQPNKLNPSL